MKYLKKSVIKFFLFELRSGQLDRSATSPSDFRVLQSHLLVFPRLPTLFPVFSGAKRTNRSQLIHQTSTCPPPSPHCSLFFSAHSLLTALGFRYNDFSFVLTTHSFTDRCRKFFSQFAFFENEKSVFVGSSTCLQHDT